MFLNFIAKIFCLELLIMTIVSDLIRENVDGEKSVRSGLNELIEKRYIQRYRVYNKDTGKVHHWETLVSEIPFSEEETYALNNICIK